MDETDRELCERAMDRSKNTADRAYNSPILRTFRADTLTEAAGMLEGMDMPDAARWVRSIA